MSCSRQQTQKAVVISKARPFEAAPRAKAGDVIPDVTLEINGKTISLHEYFTRRTGVVFAVPGAFTPVCTESHLPGFIQNAAKISEYVDDVVCMAVNDPFVVEAWGKSVGAEGSGIMFLPDPDATAVKAFGLTQDLSGHGLGTRSERFALILGSGRVRWLGLNDDAFAEVAIKTLESMPSMKGLDVDACVSAARDALKNAYAPYTKYAACGVAIQTDVGIVKGATFESCAYPNSICAVRAGIVAAVSEGARRFDGMVVAGSDKNTIPYVCGQCREILSQFGDIPVALYSAGEAHEFTNISCLLPGKVWKTLEGPLPTRTLEVEQSAAEGYKPDDTVKASPELLDLYQRAVKACHKVYTPVSHFPVGAAALTDAGVFAGSNIEHDIIGLGLCAERTMLCKAVAAGARKIKCLAVVCFKMESYGSPCGGCRQSLVEFGDYPIHLLKMDHKHKTFSILESTSLTYLPDGFTPAALC